jgi:hypothetical protein
MATENAEDTEDTEDTEKFYAIFGDFRVFRGWIQSGSIGDEATESLSKRYSGLPSIFHNNLWLDSTRFDRGRGN